jgi:glycerophosphoryl diester phosphodiesterase
MRALLPLLLLSACTLAPVAPPRAAPPQAVLDLPAVFDCLRERRLALVSAHRGQAAPDRAENAMKSFRETFAAGPILIEMDIGRTREGELVLLHDDRLDRTTTGFGLLADTSLQSLQTIRLKDGKGRSIGESLPTLSEVLRWARANGAILQLDRKGGVPFAEIVEAVREAGMAHQVVLIAYDLAATREILALAPDMMVSAGGRDAAEIDAILELGRSNPRVLFFTGTSEPDSALIARLDAARIAAITGTLGRAGERLDDRYMADGDGREYADLAASGVALIASDRPLEAWEALKANGRSGEACLTGAAQ